MKRGKKYKDVFKKIDESKSYSIDEAIKLVKENKIAKFDESVEAHVNLSIDTKKGEEQVRGAVVFPHGTGKTKRIAVVTSTKEKEAKDAGADIVSGEDLIEKIKSGKMDFDVLLATPEMMPKLAPVAKILGPKGLMPSPKTETVTQDVKKTVESLKKGKSNFKNDDSGNIHQVFGKLSFDEDKLKENLKAFVEAIKKAKPEAVKGKLITSASICSTMGPGIKINA
ncbi:50S ribosomal protein L1 [bacterium BMS3Abin15]|nr:50S ribosomal protein L1 [bacterium BMS3Abin15]